MKPAQPEKQSIFAIVGKQSLYLALFILPLVAIANIGFLFWSVESRSLFSFAELPGWLALAMVFSFLPWVTNSLRLMIWSRFFELHLTARQIFRIILGTVLGNAVTPTASGAIAVKWAFLVNENVSPDRATTLIGIQSAEDSFVSTILLALAFSTALTFEVPALFPDVNWVGSVAMAAKRVGSILLIITVAGLLLWTAIFAGIFGSNAKHFAEKLLIRTRLMFGRAARDWLYAFRSGRKYMLASIILALVQWSARHSIALLVIGFVGGQMMPMLHWTLQWLVITASSIIPTPGGAGGTESSFLLLFAPFLSDSLLGPAMVIWRGVIFYIPVAIAALIFLAFGWHRTKARIKSGSV